MTDAPWWWTDGLSAGPDGLALDGVALGPLARAHGTPLYVYGAATIHRRIADLRGALAATGRPAAIHYAMKANRFRPFLEVVRAAGVGVDAASPREVALALEVGFLPEQISVTAGMLSDRDLRALVAAGVHCNLDTRSALRRYAAIPGHRREVGLRLDPAVATGWGGEPKLAYGNSKFGVPPDDVAAVAAAARALGLAIDTLHVHPGWNLPAAAGPSLAAVFTRMAAIAAELGVDTVDVGGGLGWRHRAEDEPLGLAAWTNALKAAFGGTSLRIACEPGTFVAAPAGVLVVEANTVERRGDRTWVGIDAGHNVNVYAAHYGIPHAIVPVARPLAPARTVVDIAGNINEANDVFARARPMPALAEGDLLALLPAGAYGSAMASDHCLRGEVREVMVS
jgi:diaminopimelate decarboxylase